MRQELLRKIADSTPWLGQVMARLVAIPALGPDNGGEGEMAKAVYLTSVLEELGLRIERVDAPDPRVKEGVRPNLLAWWEGQGPGCFALSHMDVVPPGDLSLWDSDPYVMRREGSLLYGRGVSDNHSGMMASLLALKAIKEMNLPWRGRAGVALVSDEETSSRHGLQYLLHRKPGFFTPADLLLVPDSGESDGGFIEIAEKSILWLKVEVLGRQAHGSIPHMGINALYASALMIAEIYNVRARFSQTDELFHPPQSTMEPTRKEAGVENVNTIPGRDVFYIDCRILPGINLEEVEQAFRQAFAVIAARVGVSFTLTPVQKLAAPPGTSSQAPVVRALQSAIARVRGAEARVGGIGAGTVAAFFRARGLPVAVWNTDHGVAHMPNEWVDMNDIIKDAQVMALLYTGRWED
ncbi:MAG: M20 family metallo-hydrolase [Desulfarculales bacterium]|jgi:succinyl-diaminopimelate desuccinylase|nr:M20 family metallo-hydrolase [Desulfarculales bacterium]